nr:MAK10-like protein [Tanacetum cinerariifolium]
MENHKQAFVEYASSRTDEARGKWYTFRPEQNNLGDTYNSSWKSHRNLRWKQPLLKTILRTHLIVFNPTVCSYTTHSTTLKIFNNQSNLKGLLSSFMASENARLSKIEVDFKQQQGEMTNKIDTFLKAINDRITGALPSDMVKNPKLKVKSTSSGETIRNSSSPKRVYFVNTITILSKEDEPRKAKIVKQDTKDNDHELIFKAEEKNKES